MENFSHASWWHHIFTDLLAKTTSFSLFKHHLSLTLLHSLTISLSSTWTHFHSSCCLLYTVLLIQWSSMYPHNLMLLSTSTLATSAETPSPKVSSSELPPLLIKSKAWPTRTTVAPASGMFLLKYPVTKLITLLTYQVFRH